MHLVGFIIRIYHDARSFECQKSNFVNLIVFTIILLTRLKVLKQLNLILPKLPSKRPEWSNCHRHPELFPNFSVDQPYLVFLSLLWQVYLVIVLLILTAPEWGEINFFLCPHSPVGRNVKKLVYGLVNSDFTICGCWKMSSAEPCDFR